MSIFAATRAEAGFGLYIHWPFCKAKCPYCDFNSHVREKIDEAAWEQALLRELDYWGQQTTGRTLTSIFFGGGTPSLMPPRTVGALIDRAAQHWQLTPACEITLEANPTSTEAEKFKAFRAAGVNRVSVGVQALHDADLKVLGRQHGAAEALRAVELAATHFPRFSFDLIYARPQQTLKAWEAELRQALAYQPQHLSLYQLTIETGTQFFTLHQRGDLQIPSEDEGAQLYELTQQMMNAAGLPAYEISNHAATGHESRHNLTYWNYGDYVGVGAGAHGRVTLEGQKYATRNHRAPEEWLERVQSRAHSLTEQTPLPLSEQQHEFLLMGLRLKEGISRARLQAEFGGDIDTLFRADKVETLTRHGLIEVTPSALKATEEGRLRLNTLLGELVA